MFIFPAFQTHSAPHHLHINIANASPRYSLSVDIDPAPADPESPVSGTAVVKVVSRATGKPIQSIRMPSLTLFKGSYAKSVGPHGKSPSVYDDNYSFVFEDFNFDGRQDLAICKDTQGSYGGLTYDVFLWNPAQNRFVKDSMLTALSSEHLGLVAVDPQKQELTAFDKDGAAWHHSSTYKWIKHRLTLVEEETEDGTGGHDVVITTRRLVHSHWRQTIRHAHIEQ